MQARQFSLSDLFWSTTLCAVAAGLAGLALEFPALRLPAVLFVPPALGAAVGALFQNKRQGFAWGAAAAGLAFAALFFTLSVAFRATH